MAHLITFCIAAFLRGLAAHGLSIPLEAVIAASLHLPPLACMVIGMLAAVVVAEALWLLIERALRWWRAGHEYHSRKRRT